MFKMVLVVCNDCGKRSLESMDIVGNEDPIAFCEQCNSSDVTVTVVDDEDTED